MRRPIGDSFGQYARARESLMIAVFRPVIKLLPPVSHIIDPGDHIRPDATAAGIKHLDRAERRSWRYPSDAFTVPRYGGYRSRHVCAMSIAVI